MVHHLYFAACTPEGGIYHYRMENGSIRFAEKTLCDRPMYLDIQKDCVWAILRAPFADREESGLTGFFLNPDGSLGPECERQDTLGKVACHLCRYRGRIYVANYISGSIFSSDGRIKCHSGSGPCPDRQNAPHLHYVQSSPDGKCLLAVDLGTDSIYSYDEDLKLLSVARVPAGCGPRHLAYSEDGRYVFCVNELASSVSIFAYEDTKLTLLRTVCVLKTKNPENKAAAIRVQGNYVYVSNRGSDSVTCMEWDGAELKLRASVPCGGRSPRDIRIVDGLLFCANELSNNIAVFRIKGQEFMKEVDEIRIPAPVCVADAVQQNLL